MIALTPIGSAALIADALVRYGWDALSSLGAFAIAVYAGLAIVLLLVYPTILVANGLNPLRFFAGAWPAIQLGFLSRSSVGTLPVTEDVMKRGPDDPLAKKIIAAGEPSWDALTAVYPGKILDRTVLGTWSDPTKPMGKYNDEFAIHWNGAIAANLTQERFNTVVEFRVGPKASDAPCPV